MDLEPKSLVNFLSTEVSGFLYPRFFRNSGLLFIHNLQAPTAPIGWLHSDTTINKWGVIPEGPYINATMDWSTIVPTCPVYITRSLVNPCAAACRICNDFLCRRHNDSMRSLNTSRNPIVKLRIHYHGDYQEVPVTQ